MRILTALCILWLSTKMIAQYQFEQNHLDVDNGLSQNVVNVLKTDSKGFLWIGTGDGLDRYDGSTLTRFSSNEEDSSSLWGNNIMSLFEDAAGELWIGKSFLGISRYNRRLSVFRNYLSARSHLGLKNIRQVKKIVQDNKGNIWALCSAGLLRYNKKSDEFELEDFLSGYKEELLEKADLFSSTNGTLQIFVPGEGIISIDIAKRIAHKTPQKLFSIKNTTLFIKQLDGNSFAVVVDSALYRFTIDRGESALIWRCPDLITAFYVDANQNFWIGSYDLKVYHFKNEGGIVKLGEISKKFKDISKISTIRSFEITEDGTVWVGTNGAGISRIVRIEKKFGLLQYSENEIGSIYNQSIRGILPLDTDNIIIGGYSGLELFDLRKRRSKLLLDYQKKDERLVPYWLLQDRSDKDKIWIASEGGGLLTYNLRNGNTKKYGPNDDFMKGTIRNLYKTAGGHILCGTLNGILFFNTATDRYEKSLFATSTENMDIRFIMRANKNEIWAATGQNGILVLKPNGSHNKIIDLSVNTGLPNRNSINHLLKKEDGTVWAATGAGLAHISADGELLHFYTKNDGLPNNTIYAVLADNEGNLWCSTNNGISRFDVQMKTFTNYSVQDGLQSSEFNRNAFASLGDSLLYFGGLSGVNYFYPKTIKSKKLGYPVYIHSLNSANLNITTEITGDSKKIFELSHEDRELRISLSSPIYQNPNETSFYYFLDDFSKEWKKITEPNSLLLQNIPYGKYTLKIIRATPDNLNTAPVTSITLDFSAPFYLQNWFIIIMLLGFLTIGPGIYFIRTRQLMRERSIAQHFSQKLLTDQETERKRIAYALHDSLGQQLSLLKIKMRRLRLRDAETDNAEREEIVHLLVETIEDVRKISHNLHPHLLEKVGLTKSLDSFLTSYAELAPCNFTYSMDNIDRFFDREESLNLYRLVQEALNNITKHSGAKNASLSMKISEEEVTITIQDDGVGIDFTRKGEYENSMGINSMYERANFIHARITFDPNVKKGTKLSITKNLNYQYGKNKFSSTRG